MFMRMNFDYPMSQILEESSVNLAVAAFLLGEEEDYLHFSKYLDAPFQCLRMRSKTGRGVGDCSV